MQDFAEKTEKKKKKQKQTNSVLHTQSHTQSYRDRQDCELRFCEWWYKYSIPGIHQKRIEQTEKTAWLQLIL
jgi:hypothetical protein